MMNNEEIEKCSMLTKKYQCLKQKGLNGFKYFFGTSSFNEKGPVILFSIISKGF